MAYVAISQDLRNRIRNRIQLMQRKEIETDLPDLNKNYNIDAHHIFLYGCWGREHMHLVNVIPKEWLAKESNVAIRVTGDAEMDDGNFVTIKKDVGFNNLTDAYRRPATDYWNKANSEVDINDLMHMASTTPGRDELIARWHDAVAEAKIVKRWQKVDADICTFLDKVKSLNEAVKLFPAIKMYCDKSDLDRLERKVHRGPREECVEGIDLDGMAAAAVVAQLNGGV